MASRAVFVAIVALLMLTLSLSVCLFPSTEAAGTVYIRSNGDVDPSTSPIQRAGSVYTFTGNVFAEIVIQKDNIVIDGAGYAVQGTGNGTGIYLSQRNHVTIENVRIEEFGEGIKLESSSNNEVLQNRIINDHVGIQVEGVSNNNNVSWNQVANSNYAIQLWDSCDYNSILENNVTGSGQGITLFGKCRFNVAISNIIANASCGVSVYDSTNNTISANTINAGGEGIAFDTATYNDISFNNIANNVYQGIVLWYGSDYNNVFENTIMNNSAGIDIFDSLYNRIYRNSFMENANQTISDGSQNSWDNGYPSGGNYWSDYRQRYANATEIDGSGLWDSPYLVDAFNKDNYPVIPEFTSPSLLMLLILAAMLPVVVCKRKERTQPLV